MTDRLLAGTPAGLGDSLRACTLTLNQRLSSRDGRRTYYAYPTESLERYQIQLADQGRSAGNDDEARAWRHLAMAFASAIQQREKAT
jgi:hypothetical protein